MAAVELFSAGPTAPVLAWAVSCTGCFLGLLCTMRARAFGRNRLLGWRALAAASLGGTGLWVPYVLVASGFAVPGRRVALAPWPTAAAAGSALAGLAVGLLLAVRLRPARLAVPLGAVAAGGGAAGMYWLGAAALRIRAEVSVDPLLLAAAGAVAALGAVGLLAAGLRVRRWWAALAVAVPVAACLGGAHLLGMAALQVRAVSGENGPVPGMAAGDLLLPLVMGISVVSVVLVFVVALAPSEAELDELARREAAWAAREDRIPQQRQGPPTVFPPPAARTPAAARAERRPAAVSDRPRIDPDTGRVHRAGRPRRMYR